MPKRLYAPLVSVLTFGITVSSVAHAKPNEALIASLIREGATQAAYQELSNSTPQAEDVLFFRALLAQHRGEYDAAIALLNEVITIDPDHLNARRELARTFFLQERYTLAERSFSELIKLDRTPEVKEIYESFINEIRARRPFGVTGIFSVLPSSNVNRGTESLIFDSTIGRFIIDPESQATSGIGIQAGATGFYRITSGERYQDVISWGLVGSIYQESIFNTATANLSFIRSTLLSDVTRISHGPHARYTWREDDSDNSAIGFSLNLQHALTQKDTLSFAALYERVEFARRPQNTGPFARIGFTYTHQNSPSLAYNIGINASRRDTNSAQAAYTGLGISAGVNKEWTGGYLTGLALNTGLRDYRGDFPLAGEARADTFYGLSLSAQNNNWNIRGLVPRASCSYTRNKSNIAFSQYDVSECNISLNKKF